MKKLLMIIGLCALALFALSACSVNDTTATEEVEVMEDLPVDESELNTESSNVAREEGVSQVVIENMQFVPADITVQVGDTIEFVNADSVDHTVSFEDGRFDVEVPSGAVVKYTFTAEEGAGEARFFCKFHPEMRGSVLILE